MNLVTFLLDYHMCNAHIALLRTFSPRCMECQRGQATKKLSVRLSLCQTRAFLQNGRKICPDFYTIRKTFSLVFREEEWLVGASPST